MSYLLDTHALLWWMSDDSRLGPKAREIIANEPIWISTAAVWEIVIKKRIGKLKAPDDMGRQLRVHKFNVLDIKLPHIMALESLGNHHNDPFDRIQITQAWSENLIFITQDRRIAKYKEIRILSA